MFYRYRGIPTELVKVEKFKAFETLEDAMDDEQPGGSEFWTLAFVIELNMPLLAGTRINPKKDIRAKWSTKTGWLTPDSPLWSTVKV